MSHPIEPLSAAMVKHLFDPQTTVMSVEMLSALTAIQRGHHEVIDRAKGAFVSWGVIEELMDYLLFSLTPATKVLLDKLPELPVKLATPPRSTDGERT